MKKRNILIICLCIFSLFLALTPSAYANMKVSLNKSKITVKVGKTYKLKLKGTKKAAKWKSANKKIATVTKKGVKVKIRGINAGKTKITAKLGKKKYTCKVTVKKGSTQGADSNSPGTGSNPGSSDSGSGDGGSLGDLNTDNSDDSGWVPGWY